MKDEIITQIADLKDSIIQSEEYKNFIVLNEQIKKDSKVLALSFEIDKINKQISQNPKNIGELQGFLKDKINELNNLEVVKKYNEAYLKLNEIYSMINFEIIYPLNINLENKAHD